MNAPVEIVRVTKDNTDVLGKVAPDVFDAAIEPKLLAGYVEESNHLMFVAVADGLVVGQLIGVVHRHPDKPAELYLDNLGVEPDFRWRWRAFLAPSSPGLCDDGHGGVEGCALFRRSNRNPAPQSVSSGVLPVVGGARDGSHGARVRLRPRWFAAALLRLFPRSAQSRSPGSRTGARLPGGAGAYWRALNCS